MNLSSLIRGKSPIRPVDSLRGGAGALLGLLFAGLLGRLAVGGPIFQEEGWLHPLLAAPIGASAVLVFAVPASPLAQPRSVLGGNIISAFVGITVAVLVPQPLIAAPLAVGLAIATMMMLGCLHPPGGAVALITVIGGPAVTKAGYLFALNPIAVDSLLLVAAGIAWGKLTGHAYPHRVAAPRPARTTPMTRCRRPASASAPSTSTAPWPATVICWTSAATTWTPCSARSSCRPPSACMARSAAAT
jgi:CBS domain-containing membrane protein